MLARSVTVLKNFSHPLTAKYYRNLFDELDQLGTVNDRAIPITLQTDLKTIIKGLTGVLRSVVTVFTSVSESVTLIVDTVTKTTTPDGSYFNDYTVGLTFEVKLTSSGATVKPYTQGSAICTNQAVSGLVSVFQALTNGNQVLALSESYDMITVLDTLFQIQSP